MNLQNEYHGNDSFKISASLTIHCCTCKKEKKRIPIFVEPSSIVWLNFVPLCLMWPDPLCLDIGCCCCTIVDMVKQG